MLALRLLATEPLYWVPQSRLVRLVIQRVSEASVRVGGRQVGSIGRGLVVLTGIGPSDGHEDILTAAGKLPHLRVFSDDSGAMNLSLLDVGGSLLVVSQFTLMADMRRGRRPSFVGAATPEVAEPLFDELVALLRDAGVTVQTGVFGAHMEVELVNEGPVTLVAEVSQGRFL